MKRLLVVALGLMLAIAASVVAASRTGMPSSEDAIKMRANEFAAAWNTHDANKMASFWAEDGDLINPFGRVAKGRAEVEKLFRDEHAKVMMGTTMMVSMTSVRLLTPELAFVDWEGEVTGMKAPDGSAMPVFKHHVSAVMMKKGEVWLIAAARAAAFLQKPGAAAAVK